MNRAYKTVYNEHTGTFVAVAENVNAKGKRSSSRVNKIKASGIATIAAGALFMGSAMAQVVVGGDQIGDPSDSTIVFSGGNGSITGVTSITGLTSLQVGGENVVTASQLTPINNDISTLQSSVATNTSDISGLQTDVTANTSDISDLQTDVATNTSNISSLQTDVAANTSDISDLQTDVATNTSDIADINDSLTALGADENNPGVKYFRANSTAADATASGAESVAIGPRSQATSARSLAAGDDARATGAQSTAIGAATRASGARAAAVGFDAQASGTGAVAVGDGTRAGATGAVAVGDDAQAAGGVGIAVGAGARAAAANNISIGEQAGEGTVGRPANDWQNNIAIGAQAGQRVEGQRNVAMGSQAGNDTEGNDNIAFGEAAGNGLVGDSNVSIGRNANAAGGNVDRTIAIGEEAQAGTDGVAMGSFASAAGINGVAIGIAASTQGSGVGIGRNTVADSGYVALGAGSRAVAADVSGAGAFTNNPFTGSAVSVGSSEPGNEFTRRIVNVEDGANDTDAVNVRQLRTIIDDFGAAVDYDLLADKIGDNWGDQIAAAKPKYLSINDGGTPYDNVNNDGAGGVRSIALGPDASTAGTNSTAVGSDVEAIGNSSVAIGHDVKAVGVNSTVIGNDRTEARGDSGVAIGAIARSRGANSIVIGTDSEVDDQDGSNVQNSIVIGTGSVSSAQEGIVIGRDSLVNAARGIAQGDNAEATAVDAMAFGSGSRASGQRSQAQGTDARASGVDSIAIGSGSRATQARAVAQGQDAQATAADAMAFGTGSRASGNSSQASGVGAVASGPHAQASGTGAQASGTNAQASGRGAEATGTDAIAVGTGASATATNASAFGQGATAGHTGAVALGSGAVTAAAVGTASMTVDKNTYNFAGTNPVATVSVGAPGAERTITNVAAGRVSATSTDAINGSQLYGTNVALNRLADDLDTAGQSVADVLGGNAAYNPNTHQVTMTNIGGTGEDTVHDAIGYAAQGWDVGANGEATTANVAPGGSVDFSSSDGNIDIARNGTNLTFGLEDDITVGNSITISNGGPVINQGGINMNNNRITNLAPGVDGTDAVNVDQLEAVSGVANRGWDISTNGANTENVAPGDSVNFADDGNVVVSNSVDADGNHTVNVGLADDIAVDSVALNGTNGQDGLTMRGAQGAPGVNGTDGITRIVYEDGDGNVREVATMDDGLNFAGNTGDTIAKKLGETLEITGELADGADATGDNLRVDSRDGKLNLMLAQDLTNLNSITINNGPVINSNGIDMGDKKITNLAPGVDGTDAVNVDQLEAVEATANAGWNLSVGGEGATAENKVGPGGVVDISNGDGNINIARNGTDLTFDLNKDIDLGADGSLTIGDTVVNNDGLAVDDGAGNRTETTAAGTTVTNAAGDTTSVGAGSISVADAAGNETTIGSTQVVVGGGNPVTIDGDAGTIGGLTNKTFDPDNFTSGQAATEDQLKQVSDVANAGWNVTDADGNTANIGPNGQVAFVGDSNITVEQTGADDDGTVEVKLNKDIDLGADGSLTTGDTVINNGGVNVGGDVHLGNTGLVINNGPSVTTGGINAGGLVITNVAPGVADTDAVNVSQLRPISEFVNLEGNGKFSYKGNEYNTLQEALDSMHWNVEAPSSDNSGGGSGTGGSGSGNGGGSGGSTPIHNTNTVGFNGDSNIVVSKTERSGGDGADINISLADDINVKSITAVEVNAGQVKTDRVEINNGGPVIDQNGINMNDKRITNVAPGVDATDAVNVGQLQQATGNLQNQVNNLRNDLRRQDKKLSGGVAAAMATASLPQAYLPGKNMMAIAGGTWNGETGMAIGFSGISDNGHWVYKLTGNATSRGDYGGGVGIGYQW